MKYLKTFESLQDRTNNSFKKWYDNFIEIITKEDKHKYESELQAWQIYKP